MGDEASTEKESESNDFVIEYFFSIKDGKGNKVFSQKSSLTVDGLMDHSNLELGTSEEMLVQFIDSQDEVTKRKLSLILKPKENAVKQLLDSKVEVVSDDVTVPSFQ